MAVTATPVFGQTPVCGVVQISTANTNRDGTGTLGTLFTAGANGARIEYIRVKGTVTTTAGMVRIYISTNGGTNKYLWDELAVTAVTPSASAETFEGEIAPSKPLVLPASAIVYASTHNGSEPFNVFAHGADL